MQYFVVFLRYGSITSEESVRMTSGQIRDLTGVKVKTQFGLFKRWKKNGYRLVARPNSFKGKHRYVKQDHIDWICNFKTLTEMAHLPLHKRIPIIKEHCEIPPHKHFSRYLLASIYK